MLSISWTVMTLLMEFRKTKTESCHWATSWQTSQNKFFSGPLACRASKAYRPISRYRVADILRHMKIVSRASLPGLLVGFFRIWHRRYGFP